MNKIKPPYIILLVFSLAALLFFYFKTREPQVVQTPQISAEQATEPSAPAEASKTTPDGFYLEKESCNFGILYGTKWLLIDGIKPATPEQQQASIELNADMSKSVELASFEEFEKKSVRLFEFRFVSTLYGTTDVINQLDISNIEPHGWKSTDADAALACLCNERVTKEKLRSKILYTLLENYNGDFGQEQLDKTAACDKSEEMKKIQKKLSSRVENKVAQ